MLQIQDKLEDSKPIKPVRLGNLKVLKELEDRCSIARNPQARELFRILRNPHFKVRTRVVFRLNHQSKFYSQFQSLINSHDQAGDVLYQKLKNLESNHKLDKLIDIDDDESAEKMPVGEAIKMVGIRKTPDEPLGLTVEEDEFNQLKVARIIAGGLIERQGLLNAGDVILEVNGIKVMSPEELQEEISRAKDTITLKIGPNMDEEIKSARLTASGGSQVKNKLQEPGKKLAVSFAFFSLTRQRFFVLNLSFDFDLFFVSQHFHIRFYAFVRFDFETRSKYNCFDLLKPQKNEEIIKKIAIVSHSEFLVWHDFGFEIAKTTKKLAIIIYKQN